MLENIKQFCVESDVNAHGMLGWLVSAPGQLVILLVVGASGGGQLVVGTSDHKNNAKE